MPGEVSVYPFINAFAKTKLLPLLQFVCKHIHVCAHSGWSPSLLYENGTLGLPQFLTSKQNISAGGPVSVACVQVFVYAYVWKHTLAVEAVTMRRRFLAHADIIMLPLVFSSCPVCCEPTYAGSGRHLLISLQIWAWWVLHHHSPNSHAQASAGSAKTQSSQFMMVLGCLVLVIDFQVASSLACFWGSGPDAVC